MSTYFSDGVYFQKDFDAHPLKQIRLLMFTESFAWKKFVSLTVG